MSIELSNFKSEFHFIMRFLRINFNKIIIIGFFPKPRYKDSCTFGILNIKKIVKLPFE
jgi:hypothetical protein